VRGREEEENLVSLGALHRLNISKVDDGGGVCMLTMVQRVLRPF